MGKKVLFWGRFDPEYSRNRVFAAVFRELGWQVENFLVRVWPRFGDVEAVLRGLGKNGLPDLVWVPVCRQRDILAACRWAHKRGVKVAFDPMISAWDKQVLEHCRIAPGSRAAKRLLQREKRMFNTPDFVTWDTSCHLDFCAETFGVPREKMGVIFTGTDEAVFRPLPPPPDAPGAPFRVLYHGAYLPLHGVEHIIEAARLTQNDAIQWDFLGWGVRKAATEKLAQGLSNVRFLEKVPYTEVPRIIAAHDVVMGVFGTAQKASRVIGNKVFEAMACARPVVNEFSPGYPPATQNCQAVKFVPAGDGEAIANAVKEYRADWERRELYFSAARQFFEERLSMDVVKEQLKQIVDRLVAEPRR